MSDHAHDLDHVSRGDSIPRCRKSHLARWWEHWSGSRRGPERIDELGAVAVIEAWDGRRTAFFPDSGDLLRIVELDR